MIDLPGGAGHHPGFAMQQVAMKFEQIRALIGEDLAAVNETIRRRLASDVVLILRRIFLITAYIRKILRKISSFSKGTRILGDRPERVNEAFVNPHRTAQSD